MNQNITKTNAQPVRNDDFYQIYIYKSNREYILCLYSRPVFNN